MEVEGGHVALLLRRVQVVEQATMSAKWSLSTLDDLIYATPSCPLTADLWSSLGDVSGAGQEPQVSKRREKFVPSPPSPLDRKATAGPLSAASRVSIYESWIRRRAAPSAANTDCHECEKHSGREADSTRQGAG